MRGEVQKDILDVRIELSPDPDEEKEPQLLTKLRRRLFNPSFFVHISSDFLIFCSHLILIQWRDQLVSTAATVL